MVNNWNKGEKHFEKINNLKKKEGVNYYDSIKGDKLYSFLKKFINTKMKKDVKFIKYCDPPMHIWQGESQQIFNNISVDSLYIVSEDKILIEELNYAVLSSDTIKINLR